MIFSIHLTKDTTSILLSVPQAIAIVSHPDHFGTEQRQVSLFSNLGRQYNYLLAVPVVQQQVLGLPLCSSQKRSPGWHSRGPQGWAQHWAATGSGSQCSQARR